MIMMIYIIGQEKTISGEPVRYDACRQYGYQSVAVVATYPQ